MDYMYGANETAYMKASVPAGIYLKVMANPPHEPRLETMLKSFINTPHNQMNADPSLPRIDYNGEYYDEEDHVFYIKSRTRWISCYYSQATTFQRHA
jgi:hypothetical protein